MCSPTYVSPNIITTHTRPRPTSILSHPPTLLFAAHIPCAPMLPPLNKEGLHKISNLHGLHKISSLQGVQILQQSLCRPHTGVNAQQQPQGEHHPHHTGNLECELHTRVEVVHTISNHALEEGVLVSTS